MRNLIRNVVSIGAAALVILGGLPLAASRSATAAVELPSWRVFARLGANSGIEAIAPNNIWVSGQHPAHFDGINWTGVHPATDPPLDPSSNPPSGRAKVSAGAANSVWFARGGVVTSFWADCDLIAHWDGSSMNRTCPDNVQISSPSWATNSIEDVFAVGPDEAYIVGNHWSSGAASTRLDHCTATSCEFLNAPGRPNTLYPPGTDVGNIVYKVVAGTGGQDLWVGGYAEFFHDPGAYIPYSLVGHWDGTTMTLANTPEIGIINDITTVGSDDVWVASDNNLIHWDGSAWIQIPSTTGATAIEARTADDAWAVSNVIQHWDGQQWSVMPSPAATLNDVSILSADDVWAVGTDNQGVVVLHYSRPDAFSDVHYGSTFHPYIQCLAGEGIIGGYADGMFKPDNNITRGQLAKFVANAKGYTETYSSATFSDVATDNPFFQYIERLAHHGIIGGYADGTFKPNNTVTRGQEAKFISNAMGYGEPHSAASFSDVAADSTFFQYIERLAYHGVIGGYEDGTFKPDNDVTRGQTAKFVSNAFFPDCQTPASKGNAGLKPSK